MNRNTKAGITALWVGMGTLFGGLAVALVGLFMDIDLEKKAALIVFIVGMSLFVLGVVMVCVASALERRRVKQVNAALPPDTVYLYGDILAQFKEDGLAIMRVSAQDSENIVPYTHVRVYRERICTSPRSKGIVQTTLQFPFTALHAIWGEDCEDDATTALPVEEKAISLAKEHGVQFIDKSEPINTEHKRITKIIARVPDFGRKVAAWLVAEIVLLTLFILLGVYAWESTTWAAAFASGITVLVTMQLRGLLDGERLYVYTDGVWIRTNGIENEARRFIPASQIERIFKSQLGICISTGIVNFYFPEAKGAWGSLTQTFPEKCDLSQENSDAPKEYDEE